MQEKEFENILLVEGINAKGYGTIPKLVMKDRRLTAQAKAIYAYFCSYAGCGSTAFPKVSQIIYDINMTNKTYYKHFTLLTENGYITVIKRKKEGNKFDNNIYKLNLNPQKTAVEFLPTVVENLPHGGENEGYPQENDKNYQKTVDNSHSGVFPSWNSSIMHFSITQNSTTNINNNTINKYNNNNINWDELNDEEKEYLNNWIKYLENE